MIAIVAWVTVLLCTYSSASSSASDDFYSCDSDTEFYCTRAFNFDTCLPRTELCTGDSSATTCTQKTYDLCNYQSGKFNAYRYSSTLTSSTSSSRINVPRIEHQFITYRGLMYEFGTYGARIQDPSDPKYEYMTRVSYGETFVTSSDCTYGEVKKFVDIWNDKRYNVLFQNCQDFVRGLGNYLGEGCTIPRRKRETEVSEDELAIHVASISDCPSQNHSVVPLPLGFFTVCIALIAWVFG